MIETEGMFQTSQRRPGLRESVSRGLVSLTVAVGVNLVLTMSVWNVVPGIFLVYASAVASLVYGRR